MRAYWWLHSPNTNNSNNAGYVNEDGNINNNNVNNNVGVSPASSEHPKMSLGRAIQRNEDEKLSFILYSDKGTLFLFISKGIEKHILSGERTPMVFGLNGV